MEGTNGMIGLPLTELLRIKNINNTVRVATAKLDIGVMMLK